MSATIEQPTHELWWHWIIEYCPKCEDNLSQGPIRELVGEDCELYEWVDNYRHSQQGSDAFHCPWCGTKAIPTYRHGLADWNVLEDANGNTMKAELLPHQTRGEFMKAIEYDLLKAAQLPPSPDKPA